MTSLTRALGAALVVVGIIAFFATGSDSPTALIPAFLGVVLVVLGVLAGRENLHRHAIHAALVVALLGALGTLMNVAELPALLSGEQVERPAAVVASTVTFVLCVGYVALGVRSFIAARRDRDGAVPATGR